MVGCEVASPLRILPSSLRTLPSCYNVYRVMTIDCFSFAFSIGSNIAQTVISKATNLQACCNEHIFTVFSHIQLYRQMKYIFAIDII